MEIRNGDDDSFIGPTDLSRSGAVGLHASDYYLLTFVVTLSACDRSRFHRLHRRSRFAALRGRRIENGKPVNGKAVCILFLFIDPLKPPRCSMIHSKLRHQQGNRKSREGWMSVRRHTKKERLATPCEPISQRVRGAGAAGWSESTSTQRRSITR